MLMGSLLMLKKHVRITDSGLVVKLGDYEALAKAVLELKGGTQALQ